MALGGAAVDVVGYAMTDRTMLSGFLHFTGTMSKQRILLFLFVTEHVVFVVQKWVELSSFVECMHGLQLASDDTFLEGQLRLGSFLENPTCPNCPSNSAWAGRGLLHNPAVLGLDPCQLCLAGPVLFSFAGLEMASEGS